MEHNASEKSKLVAEANSLLGAANGCGARWWKYSASLSSFELVVGEPTGKDNLVLVLASCVFVSGPVSWGPQRLSVHMQTLAPEPNTWAFELRDETVNFVAHANVFGFKRDWNLLESGSVMFPHEWNSSDA